MALDGGVEWRRVRLGEVSRSFAGGTPSRSRAEYFGPGVPWLKSGEVRAGRIERTEETITPLALKESSARMAKAGTPVVAMYGATAGIAGVLGIDAALNQAVLAVQPQRDVLDAEFCYRVLQAYAGRLLELTQGSGQPNLSKALIEGLEFSLPALDEQQRIAEVLRAVEEAVSTSESARTQAIHVLAKARLAFTGLDGSRPDWPRGPVLDFFQLQRGHDLPVQDRIAGPVPVIASNGLVGTHNKAAITAPAVVTGRSGTIGKVSYFDGPAWPLNTTLFVRDYKGSHPRYVFHFLSAFPLTDYQSGTGVPTLNRNDVHAVEVAWPGVDEQTKIVASLDALEETVRSMSSGLEHLRALKARLSTELLSGRVRVPR